MESKNLTVHACEQVLRFSRVKNWNDLSEERKVQLGFNMGVMSLGLGLSKEDGYTAMSNAREGKTSMQDFRVHLLNLVSIHDVKVSEDNIARSF